MDGLNQSFTGGCACGAARYVMHMEPMIVHACHCKDCQRQTGSWHAVNALIESHEVDLLQGELEYVELETGSGAGQTVARCSHCGVAVWSNYHLLSRGQGDIIRFIRVGTLDEPHRLPPDVHIFDSERNACAPQPQGAPRFETLYDFSKVWAPASLRRLYSLYESPSA